nr:MAG TPA: hypothetical protein [Caudoviricetes sp.]
MTILYDVVSLLRVFPSIGANLEPYSKKENGEKAITSAPNRVLRTGRRIKSVLKHVFRTFARKETSLRSSSTTKRARLPHFNEATCGFRSPALAGRIDSTSRVLRRKDPTGTVRCRSTEPKEKNKKVSLTPNQSVFSG